MRLRSRTLLFSLIAGLLVLAWTQRGRFTPVDVGSPAPAFAGLTLQGDSFSIASARGRVLVLNVWATWCAPCLKEMPALQRLHEKLPGVQVVAVSTDEDATLIQPWVDRFGLTFDIVHDPHHEMEAKYLVHGLPTTFVIDRTGRIAHKIQGARAWDDTTHVAMLETLVGQS